MAHQCPICGQECYCDMEDCEFDDMPDDCPHWDCEGDEDCDEMCDFETEGGK